MILRDLREEDLISCLEVQPGRMGMEFVERSEGVRTWTKLIRSRSFNATVVEADLPGCGRRIVGFGASVFVLPAFALDEITNPRPGLNARIIASIARGRPIILSETDLRFANTEGELDLVILYGSFRRGVLIEPELSEGYTLMGAAFLEKHIGYRINQMISEVVDNVEKHYNERTNAWRVISNFEEFWASHADSEWDRSRALAVIQREAFAKNGSFIDLLFLRRNRVLELRDTDQQLLIAALNGATDEELARSLNQNLPTIKKRWASLFERMLELRPDLFPDGNKDNGSSRGKQKRHHLLAYVRSHPEELRPFQATGRSKKPTQPIGVS